MGLGFSPLAPDFVPFVEARTLTHQSANARHQLSSIEHHVVMHMRFTRHGSCHTIPQAPHAQRPFYGTGARSWFGINGTDCAACDAWQCSTLGCLALGKPSSRAWTLSASNIKGHA